MGLSIFVYAPTTNLYFVFYRSLDWDAICEVVVAMVCVIKE
jgi:hypothetical protein